ncbi:MAG: DNA cytosine methyltransferase [Verrucomicrobiota bacterium]
MGFSVNSYFSGFGLMDIGLSQAGVSIGQSFEIDGTASRVQRENLGHDVVTSDISKKLVSDENDSDVMVFTYPCTKYSTIADIHGTRSGDELFLHAFRHMALKRPEVYVIENVPGMRAFPLVMEAMAQLPDYWVISFCPIRSQTWLPQRRDRLIIFGAKRNFGWREPEVGKRASLASIVEDDPRVTLPKAIGNRMQGKYRDRPIISDPAEGDIAPTCVAHYAKDKSTRLLADKHFPMGVRPYSVREYARLQGVPDWYAFNCSDTEAYRGIGNGVSVPVGRWIGQELTRYFNQ